MGRAAAPAQRALRLLRCPSPSPPEKGHISPGYHMNKKHWITVESGELVTDSYRLVVAHLPKAERPVGPHTYGTGTRAAR